MIRDVLGGPDAEVPNPYYSKAAPMQLYYLRRVVAAEASEQYQQARQKADKRRHAAQKGLSAARAVRAAEDVLKAEAAEVSREDQTEEYAVRLIGAALDLDSSLTMAERRAYRQEANETLQELGYELCHECAWRHGRQDLCIAALRHAHEEARIAAQVNAVFVDHEQPSTAPRPDPRPRRGTKANRKRGVVGWSPDNDPDCCSKSEVGRRTGWTSRMIEERLGEPDRVAFGYGTPVKLYLKSRVVAAKRTPRTTAC